ncbi:MAG: glycosyltransferase [Planctomycetota bacterium]|jgi:hypothetical protein
MRPVPRDSRLVTLREAPESKRRYYCIITHNVTDLLDIKDRPEPRLIVLHSTIEGRIEQEKSNLNPETMRGMLHKYLELVNCHAVATCTCKGKSWGLTEEIVTFGIDADEYLTYSGEIACGLRICNFIESRKKILLWDFHKEAFAGIPLRLVGHNPGMPGVAAAETWAQLKRILQSHRFYIHTADPRFEAGYNMACVEAMAAGLPVPGNQHPTSPVKHGVNGFLSDDPKELRRYAVMLLENRDLAVCMARQARETAKKHFPMSKFKKSFLRSIEVARCKWASGEPDRSVQGDPIPPPTPEK